MMKFKKKTSNPGLFSNIFKMNSSFESQISKWSKTLKRTLFACFKKVRLSSKKAKPTKCKFFQKRKRAIYQKDKKSKIESEEQLKREEALNNMNKIQSNINSLKQSKSSQNAIWK